MYEDKSPRNGDLNVRDAMLTNRFVFYELGSLVRIQDVFKEDLLDLAIRQGALYTKNIANS